MRLSTLKYLILGLVAGVGLAFAIPAFAAELRIYIGAIGSNSSAALLWDSSNQRLSVNSSTPGSTVVIQGSSTAPTLPIFTVASSSKAIYLTVSSAGTTTLQGLILNNVASGSQCLHALSTGQIVGTGSDCGSGGGSATTTITAGGIATGPAITFASASPDTTYNIICATATCTFDHPNNLVTFGYASSSYLTLWNTVAGANITITTSTNPTIAVIASPTFTNVTVNGTLGVTGQTTLGNATATGLTLTNFFVTGTSTLASTTVTNFINSSVKSALVLNNATGREGAYGGASACSSGQVVTAISAVGGTTCASTGIQTLLTNPDVGTGSQGQVAYFNASTTNLSSGIGLLDNGTIAGVNATTSTVDFQIQGTGAGTNSLFNITTSSGGSLFKVTNNGSIGIGSSTPNALLTVEGTSTFPVLPIFTVASSSNFSYFNIAANDTLGINTTTAGGTLTLQGTTSQTNDLFDIASSTGANILSVNANNFTTFSFGTTTINLAVLAVQGNTASATLPLFNIASSSGANIMQIDANGHIHYGGIKPTVSSCGTGTPTVTGSDSLWNIITGTGSPTACTLTFATAFKNVVCVVVDDLQTSEVSVTATSTTAITMTMSAALTSHNIYGMCGDTQ